MKVKWSSLVIYTIMVAACVACAVLMQRQAGLMDGDFGPGQYYYTDIPNWQKYFSVDYYRDTLPRWIYYVLFFVWGYAMYRLWRWIDSRGGKDVDNS